MFIDIAQFFNAARHVGFAIIYVDVARQLKLRNKPLQEFKCR